MAKRIPLRMCVCCRRMLPKKELLRLLMSEEGLTADLRGRMPGRGFYLCVEESCAGQFFELKFLRRLFKRKLEAEEAEALRAALLPALSERRTQVRKEKSAETAERGARIIRVSGSGAGTPRDA